MIDPCVTLHLIDDAGVLLDAHRQSIFRLDQTSTLLWCCLAENWSDSRIVDLLERRGLSPADAAQFLASTIAVWREMGLLEPAKDHLPSGGKVAEAREDLPSWPDDLAPATANPPPFASDQSLCYRILDSDFELLGVPAWLAAAMDDAFGNLRTVRVAPTALVCTLTATTDGYVLTEGVRVVGQCSALEAVVPMVKAALIRAAIEKSAAFAIVHAAAVWWKGRGVVLPGPAGSGKSTLAANLILDGAMLAAEDITVLAAGPPLEVRPLPTAPCLKTDAWPVMMARGPELDGLPVHRRADGQRVRYLKLRPSADASATRIPAALPVGLIAFPRYRPGAPLGVRRLGAGEAFDRLLPQFYPVSNRFDAETIDRLIDLVETVTSVELSYGDGSEAADAVRSWAG